MYLCMAMTTETHPLTPFLPASGRILFLGSFPPPRERWSMEFFYPNWINDFWRIMGLIFHEDAQHFVAAGQKRFDEARIKAFAQAQGLAFFDTAYRVCRLRGNASDAHLQILEPSSLASLLEPMPGCQTVVTTGGKASEELHAMLQQAAGAEVPMPAIGESVQLQAYGRTLRWWRMPSTSRAYPLSLSKKAGFYSRLFPSLSDAKQQKTDV